MRKIYMDEIIKQCLPYKKLNRILAYWFDKLKQLSKLNNNIHGIQSLIKQNNFGERL